MLKRISGLGVMALLLASPVQAGTIYSWRTEDGSYAFSDDEKSIPPRYQEQARERQAGDLSGYERYTGKDGQAMSRYREGLAARLQHLRELNGDAPPAAGHAASAAEPRVRQSISLRAGGEHAPSIELTPAHEGPVVMEWKRYKPRGQIATRHNLIVRQGDETLAVVKGRQGAEINASSNIHDEEELEAGR